MFALIEGEHEKKKVKTNSSKSVLHPDKAPWRRIPKVHWKRHPLLRGTTCETVKQARRWTWPFRAIAPDVWGIAQDL